MRTITNELEDLFLAGWSLMLGIFLALTPWYIGYTGDATAAWNAWSCGGGIAVLSLIGLVRMTGRLEYAIAAIGLWLCAAPWLLGFATLTAPTWTQTGFGLAVLVCAGGELWRLRRAPGTRTARSGV